MKDISIYFKSVDVDYSYNTDELGDVLYIHKEDDFPILDKKGIALFDVGEYRNHTELFESTFSPSYRKSLYKLYRGANWGLPIFDLGTIVAGQKVEDTFYALSSVVEELVKNDIIPIVIGGTQDLTKAIYGAYEKLEQFVNLTTVDNQLDIGGMEDELRHDGWLNSILLHQPCYLFNYSNIGAQSHYIPPKNFDLFNELYFDICRLGQVNQDSTVVEPILRNTDVLSFDLASIRANEFQSPYYNHPNGLFANEACRVMRYAGISDKLSSVGIFNYYSEESELTDEIVAQLIWYFIEGYMNRKGDFPLGSKKSYTKYRVFIEELNEEIAFYKSDKSARWWIEVPYPGKTDSKYYRHQLVPCSYKTYEETMKGEIPDLWWKTYQKFS